MGIAGALLSLVVPYFIMHFDKTVESSQSLCPFKMLTGFPCPACGITKSFIFFYEGDIWKSLSYHLFGPVFIFLCIFAVFVLIAEIVSGREFFNSIFFSKKLAYALGITLAGYHIIRLIIFVHDHSVTEILKESIWM